MALHTAEPESRDGDYFGSSVNRAARLMAVAHGGQIVCSQATADLAHDVLPDDVALVDLGEHRLRDLLRAEHVFQVSAVGLPSEFGPLASLDAFPGNLPLQVSSFIEFFRTKKLLLVVDNCEHVLEAVADVVDVLERSCAGLVVLATSREGLALEGERIVAIPSLASPAPEADLAEMAQSDAVRLF